MTARSEELDRATVDQLDAQPPARDATDAHVDNTLAAENERRVQANQLRKRFFWAVVCAMCFVLVASVGIMGFYIWSEWGEIDTAVMIAWLSATVVQTIGLAYIIANYLFPALKGNGNGS